MRRTVSRHDRDAEAEVRDLGKVGPPLRVLLAVQPAWSHIATVLPLAQALLARGNDVRVAAAAAVRPVFEGRGLPFMPAGPDWDASRVEQQFPGFLGAR